MGLDGSFEWFVRLCGFVGFAISCVTCLSGLSQQPQMTQRHHQHQLFRCEKFSKKLIKVLHQLTSITRFKWVKRKMLVVMATAETKERMFRQPRWLTSEKVLSGGGTALILWDCKKFSFATSCPTCCCHESSWSTCETRTVIWLHDRVNKQAPQPACA